MRVGHNLYDFYFKRNWFRGDYVGVRFCQGTHSHHHDCVAVTGDQDVKCHGCKLFPLLYSCLIRPNHRQPIKAVVTRGREEQNTTAIQGVRFNQ